MAKIVIFVLGKPSHVWSWFLDIFLVRVDSYNDKNFTCSTDYLGPWINMLDPVKLNA